MARMGDERKPRVAEPQRRQAVMRFEMPEDTLAATHPARVLWEVVGTWRAYRRRSGIVAWRARMETDEAKIYRAREPVRADERTFARTTASITSWCVASRRSRALRSSARSPRTSCSTPPHTCRLASKPVLRHLFSHVGTEGSRSVATDPMFFSGRKSTESWSLCVDSA